MKVMIVKIIAVKVMKYERDAEESDAVAVMLVKMRIVKVMKG